MTNQKQQPNPHRQPLHGLLLFAFFAGLGATSLLSAGCGGDPSDPTGDPTLADPALGSEAVPRAFDVAEDMSRFAFDDAPIFDDGMPAYGNTFVTQGYIYPHGFLDDKPGVNADGTPTHPEAVLGEWTCRGVFIGEGAHTQGGAWVISTQLYAFYEEPGALDGDAARRTTLVSEGYELSDVGVPYRRALTGGTAGLDPATREIEQVFLGFNAGEGVNLRFRLVRR